MASNLKSLERRDNTETEVVPGGILTTILRAFPLDKDGKVSLGNHEFTLNEIKKGTVISGGSMHTVIILPERELVLKFNKPRIIGDTYADMQMQLAAFRSIKEQYPELQFHFPQTEIIPSETVEGAYAIVSEQVIGQTMMMSDCYNRALFSQIKDLRKVFYLLLKETHMPICLDLMGAKEGIRCFLYGLEVIHDFKLANLIVTDNHEINIVDFGNALSTLNNWIKNCANGISIPGHIATIEQMYFVTREKGESLIR
ncbi:MAG: hypothetical protein ACK4NC_04375 [Candidatus Gracilibacteria bacterium]